MRGTETMVLTLMLEAILNGLQDDEYERFQ